ncbi:hypothetical protein, conserved [Plasmodium gonderi]|uniref:Uncharacterized protein n=1 Tax=Plasmodium gonderi TaxID=77519 RepID=A0A1Y1JP25_PLAGO|nr:hypothetical protein, conserved [Plasmodium gonderi]GAW83288.1 hypothetical protein, conserved [Plasmodium gonderi]
MDTRNSYSRSNTFRSAKDESTKNNREEQDDKNDSHLLTIYSFISSYVFKEDMNYDENDSRYELLESQDLENEKCEKKVSFSEYSEKVYRYYGGRSEKEEGEVEEDEETDEEDHTEDESDYEKQEEDEDDEGDKEEDGEAENDANVQHSENEEDVIIQGSVPSKKKKSKGHRKKGISSSSNNVNSMTDENYRVKEWKRKEKKKRKNARNNAKMTHMSHPIKTNINNISKYFMLSMDNTNEQENIFKDEKQLSRQMSYYNDAYYYTSEMIYKNDKRHKEKFALYLRLMSLFFNIMIGIYLITHFPHTHNENGTVSENRHSIEYDNLKEIIRNRLESSKKHDPYADKEDAHLISLTTESEVLKNNEKKKSYLDILFRGSKQVKEIENEHNLTVLGGDENGMGVINADKKVDIINTEMKGIKKKVNGYEEMNNLIKEIDIVNLIDDEYIMNYIYLEMNKIYKYAIYSFFGELLVISIIVFSLFILRIFIKDNNKFSVILTMYGILYKIFCYIFAHYVLVMGVYILSIYYNIYVNRDIYEHSFNFFCFHYVYNNIHIHLLMLFYAFQNIIFTINDTFNCIRMMFIILKHLIVKIYEKITCKNFITFYELKEDKSPLSLNCMNKIKKKCDVSKKCCRDKNCVEIDIDEIHELGYDKSDFPFGNFHQKPYCKNLDIKTYEQSLLNMRNPIFK